MIPAIAAALLIDEDHLGEQMELRRARNARRAEIRRTNNALNDVPDLEFHDTYREFTFFFLCSPEI